MKSVIKGDVEEKQEELVFPVLMESVTAKNGTLVVLFTDEENVILDKKLFFISGSAFDAFEQALNNPVGDNKCITKLMERPDRWG